MSQVVPLPRIFFVRQDVTCQWHVTGLEVAAEALRREHFAAA